MAKPPPHAKLTLGVEEYKGPVSSEQLIGTSLKVYSIPKIPLIPVCKGRSSGVLVKPTNAPPP